MQPDGPDGRSIDRSGLRVVRNRAADRYELRDAEEVIGTARYLEAEDRLVVTRVEIRTDLRGHGLGAVLARGVLDDLRAAALKVEPRCWFLAEYIDGHPADADLVATTH